jgi:hypothetical protein
MYIIYFWFIQLFRMYGDAILNWQSRQAFVFQSNEYRDLIILYYTAISDVFLV